MNPIVTLVNANEMRPPVGPVALDYLAAGLESHGFEPRVLDLTWAGNAEAAIARHFAVHEPVLVALTVRNVDDCYMASQHWCIPHARETVELLRRHTGAPIVVGGVGYSVMPGALLPELGVDYGVAGEGEDALPALARALAAGDDPTGIAGLVWRDGGDIRVNPRQPVDLAAMPLSRRAWLDNARYWREGGQGGFETKRGCGAGCIYCADPLSKGRAVRLRDPRDVAQEIANLVAQGVAHLHTCDAEFNMPRSHALAVCDAIIETGLAERVRWWAYCAPGSFDDELAERMRRAGCVGIDFGADHGCDEQLARLGRDHRMADLERTAEACRRHGIVFMFDILLGAPGETRETVGWTIEAMKRLAPDRVGISAGVRLYPDTPLAAQVIRGPLIEQPGLTGALEGNDDLRRPVFYVAPELGPGIGRFVNELAGDDPRFLCPEAESGTADYNYRENPTLTDAIQSGYRGAYWDILRRLQEGLGPV